MNSKYIRGKIILENGRESVFFLNQNEVEILEEEVAKMKEHRQVEGIKGGDYLITDELAYAVARYLDELREQRSIGTSLRNGKKGEAPTDRAVKASKT